MANERSRYKQMELYMTAALLIDTILFVLYLIFALLGISWLKVITAVIAIILSILCLCYLYLSKELLKRRSLWMTVGAAAVLLCIIFSLVLKYPAPKISRDNDLNTPTLRQVCEYHL